MNKKIKVIIILLLFIVGILLTYFVTKQITKKRYKQPEIEEIIIFGEKIKIKSNKKVYRFFIDSAKVEYTGDGCKPEPIEIKFKDNYEEYDGFYYYENGEKHIAKAVSVKKKNSKNEGKIETKNEKINLAFGYDIYVEVILDKPLEVDSHCDGK